jgi:NTP pyrophosphatase (non-canonical NTP hydrolase)
MLYSEFVETLRVKLPTRWDNEMHMVLGITSEAGELAGVYKDSLAYGKELDDIHIVEELGDLLYFIQGLCNVNGWSLETVLDRNVAKLTARYADEFTPEKALNRDLEAERAALEPDEDDKVSR